MIEITVEEWLAGLEDAERACCEQVAIATKKQDAELKQFVKAHSPGKTFINAGKGKQIGGSSKYKGVYKRKDGKRWRAGITKWGKGCSLGSFVNEIDAARAYDRAAIELFGDHAKTNAQIYGI